MIRRSKYVLNRLTQSTETIIVHVLVNILIKNQWFGILLLKFLTEQKTIFYFCIICANQGLPLPKTLTVN